jgi:hypothetical protein
MTPAGEARTNVVDAASTPLARTDARRLRIGLGLIVADVVFEIVAVVLVLIGMSGGGQFVGVIAAAMALLLNVVRAAAVVGAVVLATATRRRRGAHRLAIVLAAVWTLDFASTFIEGGGWLFALVGYARLILLPLVVGAIARALDRPATRGHVATAVVAAILPSALGLAISLSLTVTTRPMETASGVVLLSSLLYIGAGIVLFTLLRHAQRAARARVLDADDVILPT